MEDTIHPVDKFVGAKVRMARLSSGLSQTELANKLGITFQQVQKYESGKNRVSASRLYDIAQVVSAEISYFFEEYGDGIVADENSPTGQMNVYDYINSPDMIGLIQAFNKIDDRDVRKAVVNLVKSMQT